MTPGAERVFSRSSSNPSRWRENPHPMARTIRIKAARVSERDFFVKKGPARMWDNSGLSVSFGEPFSLPCPSGSGGSSCVTSCAAPFDQQDSLVDFLKGDIHETTSKTLQPKGVCCAVWLCDQPLFGASPVIWLYIRRGNKGLERLSHEAEDRDQYHGRCQKHPRCSRPGGKTVWRAGLDLSPQGDQGIILPPYYREKYSHLF